MLALSGVMWDTDDVLVFWAVGIVSWCWKICGKGVSMCGDRIQARVLVRCG